MAASASQREGGFAARAYSRLWLASLPLPVRSIPRYATLVLQFLFLFFSPVGAASHTFYRTLNFTGPYSKGGLGRRLILLSPASEASIAAVAVARLAPHSLYIVLYTLSPLSLVTHASVSSLHFCSFFIRENRGQFLKNYSLPFAPVHPLAVRSANRQNSSFLWRLEVGERGFQFFLPSLARSGYYISLHYCSALPKETERPSDASLIIVY